VTRLHHAVAALSLIIAPMAHAQVTRIVIDSVASPAFGGAWYGAAGQYETISGRAFGELDPNDRRNRIITDLQFAPRNARGRVEYVATFYIVKPIDLSRSSHLMWHDVPNRGGRITINVAERNGGDIPNRNSNHSSLVRRRPLVCAPAWPKGRRRLRKCARWLIGSELCADSF
jgi:hypothetical protein